MSTSNTAATTHIGAATAKCICDAGFAAPMAWLQHAIADIVRAPAVTLSAGSIMAAAVYGAQALSAAQPALALPITLLIIMTIPFAFAALYSVARAHTAGRRVSFSGTAVDVRRSAPALGIVAMLVGLLFAAGIRVTALIVALAVGPTFPAELLKPLLETPMILGVGGGAVAVAILTLTLFGLPNIYARRLDIISGIVGGITLVRSRMRAACAWVVLVIAVAIASVWLSPMVLIFGLPMVALANWHGFERISREGAKWRA